MTTRFETETAPEEFRPGHRTILGVLYRNAESDEETGLRSKDIRERGEIKEGSFHHFLRPLRDQGLVEIGGYKEMEGGANDAPLYELTERGVSVAMQLPESHEDEDEDEVGGTSGVDYEKVAKLHEEIEDLQSTISWQEKRLEQLEAHREFIERLREQVEGDEQ